MKKIVVDMMGSDLGSVATKEGVSLFHEKHPDVELILVGKEAELKDMTFAKIVNADDVVEMTCGALEVIRRKGSSMVVALNTAKEENADGMHCYLPPLTRFRLLCGISVGCARGCGACYPHGYFPSPLTGLQ